MSEVFECREDEALQLGLQAARLAIRRGELIVMPTDTVYGIAADAFSPAAVHALLEAKGRGRQSPPPVLIPNSETLGALAAEVTASVRTLAEHFWPGPLTIVLRSNPMLSWDLGDTGGTVALRIPNDALSLQLLAETGPLAVSSANLSGEAAARNVAEAQGMLGENVAVYLDAGEIAGDGTPSTIIDGTRLDDSGGTIRILRMGGISREQLAQALPGVIFEE